MTPNLKVVIILFVSVNQLFAWTDYKTWFTLDSIDSTEYSQWTVVGATMNPPKSLCSLKNEYIFGGNQVFGLTNLSITISSIPTHKAIRTSFTLVVVGSWNETNDMIAMAYDSNTQFNLGFDQESNWNCVNGDTIPFSRYNFSIPKSHTASSVTLHFYGTPNSSNVSQKSWGIRDIVFSYETGSCDSSCLTCFGNSSSECETCQSGKYLDKNHTNTYNQASQTCQACSYKCLTCVNATSCTTCADSTNRNTTTNFCACKRGTMDQGVAACFVCPTKCGTCHTNGTCTTCFDVNKTMSSGCTSCKIGYFAFTDSQCYKCSNRCYSCSTNPLNCTACISAYRTTPSCACDSGYEENTFYMSCDYVCKTYQQYSGGSCVNLCTSNQYQQSGSCQSCDSSCAECRNSTASDCTACSGSKFIYPQTLNSTYGKCVVCEDIDGLKSPSSSASKMSDCEDICGDGVTILKKTADYCDDGNTLDGDGCSSDCQVEYGWVCEGGSFRTRDYCVDRNPIYYEVEVENQEFLNVRENIFFSFILRLSKSPTNDSAEYIRENVLIEIESLKADDFKVLRVTKVDKILRRRDLSGLNKTWEAQVQYKFELKFYKTLYMRHVIVTLNSGLADSAGNKIQRGKSTDVIEAYIYVSSDERDDSIFYGELTQYVLLAFFGVTLRMVYKQESFKSLSSLDLFQQIYFLKMLNFQIPTPLLIYLDHLSSLTDFFLPNLYKDYLEDTLSLEQVHEQSTQYGDSYILRNLSPIISLYPLLLIIHLFLRILEYISSRVDNESLRNFSVSLSRFRKKHFVYGIYYDLYKFTFFLMVIFSIIQIHFNGQNTVGLAAGSAILALLLVIFVRILFINVKFVDIVFTSQARYEELELEEQLKDPTFAHRRLWNGINLNQMVIHFQVSVDLTRKLIYSLIIIFCENPSTQLTLLVVFSILYGLVIFVRQPYKNTRDNYKLIINEIFLLVLLFILRKFRDLNVEEQDEIKNYSKLMIQLIALLIALHTLQLFGEAIYTMVQEGRINRVIPHTITLKEFSENQIQQQESQFKKQRDIESSKQQLKYNQRNTKISMIYPENNQTIQSETFKSQTDLVTTNQGIFKKSSIKQNFERQNLVSPDSPSNFRSENKSALTRSSKKSRNQQNRIKQANPYPDDD